jgi:axial budding pattern protein 2
MALRGLFAVVAIFGPLAEAIPIISFPLNSQVPPVARVAEFFSYTFSTSTFSSTLPLSYAVSSGPSWLSLDSNTRTLSGTPSSNDVGTDAVTGIPIGLTATDASGSTTLNATLIVSTNPAPILNNQPSTQLATFGTFSAPATLSYHPSTPFKFTFEADTFSENGNSTGLVYYAVTVDNTPLPSWITFDGSSLSFTGQTPDYHSLILPPQTFGIQLIASDVEGFSGAVINFDIEVGVHVLVFTNSELVINTSAGDTINFDGLVGMLELDGQIVVTSNVASITAQTPAWLAFNNLTLIITGTVPNDAISFNVTVQAIDIHGNTANATVYLDISTGIFSAQIGTLNATVGSGISYDLSTYLRNKSDIDMTATFVPSKSWPSFDPKTFILAGSVPQSTLSSTIEVTLNATSISMHTSGSQVFILAIIPGASLPSSSSTARPSRTVKPPTTSQTGAPTASSFVSHKPLSKKIILAIFIPIGVLLTAIMFALFCHRKRRREANRHHSSLSKEEISAPLEATSSVVEIVRQPRVAAPAPLHLNMSGFGVDTSSGIDSGETKPAPKPLVENPLRRSQTMSAASDARLSRLRDSDNSGNRFRSNSENALSKTDRTWRSTQDSKAFTNGSSRTNSSKSQRLSRNYSNYSRKGHTRRSAMLFSSNSGLQSELSAQPSEGPLLNLRDNSFSYAPLDKFSVLSKYGSILESPERVSSSGRLLRSKSRRQSRFMPTLGRTPGGIGHGGRESISSLPGNSGRRRSVGHGQDWASSRGLARDSQTWLTVASTEPNQRNSRSSYSALSEYEDDNKRKNGLRMSTIRQVPKSPSVPAASSHLSQSSGNSRTSRPVSRRLGESPFFGGSSRNSRKSPKKVRTSFADSPTVPEEVTMGGSLNDTAMHDFQEEKDTIPRDSFGISYGLAREGTSQLKSYIQSQLSRTRTKSSIVSNESKDSRFESASGSMRSLQQTHLQRPPERQNPDDEYEDYLPDDYSEGSWETQQESSDSQENMVGFAAKESEKATSAAATTPGFTGSKSNPNSPMLNIGQNASILPGASRRPVSVNAKAKRASRAKVEGGELDYTAYI